IDAGDVAVEAIGRLDQDARTVTGVGLGPGRTAVVQATHGGERLIDEIVRRATFDVDDKSDAARIVFEAWVVERRKLAFGHNRKCPRVQGGQFRLWSWPPRDDIGPSAERRSV